MAFYNEIYVNYTDDQGNIKSFTKSCVGALTFQTLIECFGADFWMLLQGTNNYQLDRIANALERFETERRQAGYLR